MKHMKKLACLLLAMVMILALSATALASETTGTTGSSEHTDGSITISNATVSETYSIYKVFDLTYVGEGETEDSTKPYKGVAYTYTKKGDDDKLFGALTGTGTVFVLTPSASDANKYVVTKARDNSGNEYSDEAIIASVKTLLPNLTKAANDVTATSTTVKFENLGYGYYYVTSTLGTLVTIDSTLKDVEVQDKNVKPTVDKKVKENSTQEWGESNDTDSYSHVEYKTTITAYAGVKNLALHDDMDLYLDQTGQLYWTLSDPSLTALGFTTGGEFVTYDYTNLDRTGWPEGYTHLWCYKNTGTGGDNKTYGLAYVSLDQTTIGMDFTGFDMLFTNNFVNRITGTANSPTTIEILYKGDMRAVGQYGIDQPNTNKTWITYGANQKSGEVATTTTTHGLKIFKYTKDTETEKTPLANAEFVLKRNDNDNSEVAVTKLNGGYVVVGNSSVKSAPKTTDTTTTLVSGEDGYIKIYGLDSGKYELTETKAPDGYNLMTEFLTIKIDNAGKVYYRTGVAENGNEIWSKEQTQVEVLNNTGTELPSTGGMGTTIFYVLGAILVIGAAVLLVVRRRMNSEE